MANIIHVYIYQGCPNSVLDGWCPAEFSSNMSQHTCWDVSSYLECLVRAWLAGSGVLNWGWRSNLQDTSPLWPSLDTTGIYVFRSKVFESPHSKILCNIITIQNNSFFYFNTFSNVIHNCDGKAEFLADITSVFSVAWSFRNHKEKKQKVFTIHWQNCPLNL